MRFMLAILAAFELQGQAPGPNLCAVPLHTPAKTLNPREMIQAMVAQELVKRHEPGVTVEVIGDDNEIILKLLSQTVTEKARLQFTAVDKVQHRELRSFMQQDPTRPAPILFVPRLPGP